jgi:hypothetical protein
MMKILKNKYLYAALVLGLLVATGSVFANSNVSISARTDSFASLIEATRTTESLQDEITEEVSANMDRIIRGVYNIRPVYTDENGDIVHVDVEQAMAQADEIFIDYENAYKVYGLNSSNVAADYARVQTLETLISDDFSINIPVLDSDGSVISLIEMRKIRGADELNLSGLDTVTQSEMIQYAEENEGAYKISIIGLYMPKEAVEHFSNMSKFNTLLQETGLSGIQEVKIVSMSDYGAETLYISSGSQEYVIPYRFEPENATVESTALTQASAFTSELTDLFE